MTQVKKYLAYMVLILTWITRRPRWEIVVKWAQLERAKYKKQDTVVDNDSNV